MFCLLVGNPFVVSILLSNGKFTVVWKFFLLFLLGNISVVSILFLNSKYISPLFKQFTGLWLQAIYPLFQFFYQMWNLTVISTLFCLFLVGNLSVVSILFSNGKSNRCFNNFLTCDQALFSFRSVKHSGGTAKTKNRAWYNSSTERPPPTFLIDWHSTKQPIKISSACTILGMQISHNGNSQEITQMSANWENHRLRYIF